MVKETDLSWRWSLCQKRGKVVVVVVAVVAVVCAVVLVVVALRVGFCGECVVAIRRGAEGDKVAGRAERRARWVAVVIVVRVVVVGFFKENPAAGVGDGR